MSNLLVACLSAAVFAVPVVAVVTTNKAEEVGYAKGLRDGKASCDVPRVQANLDHQCTAWFFDTNLKTAKARMCGRR